MHIDQRTLERLAARLPGYDVAELRVLETRAQILPDELVDAEDETIALRLAEEHKVAGPPMINKDGRPTILKIVMWMCHADVVNLNGDSFVGEELKAAAPALFREPNFGVMDWNHAAVFQFGDDPRLMGVWHKADWAFDKQAEDGKGAWGLLVTGMMFAWLFPEQTDALVAEQLRSGSVKGSMACIPKSVEFADVNGRRAAVLHNPVFFTHSLLDVPPADQSATGRVSENPDTTVDTLRQEVLSGTESLAVDTASVTIASRPVADPALDYTVVVAELKEALHQALARAAAKEEVMTPEQIAELEKAKADLEAKVAELTAKVAELEAAKAPETPTEEPKDLAAELAATKTTLAEITTSRDALASELDAARAEIAAKDAKIAELQAVVDAAEAAKASEAKAATLAARKAELPESFLKAHEERDEATRAAIEVAWSDMDDEKWAFHKSQVLLFGFTASGKAGYVARSKQEGVLLNQGTPSEDTRGKLRASLKNAR